MTTDRVRTPDNLRAFVCSASGGGDVPVVRFGFASLVGSWRIWRSIDDRYGRQCMTGKGNAHFEPAGADVLEYHERLNMRFAHRATPLAATGSFVWRYDHPIVEVVSRDRLVVQRFDLLVDSHSYVHDCGPDRYEGRCDFSKWPDWTSSWDVVGPRKDYLMTTRFRR
ncbi:MAG: DUF6314 family protein [Actinomycetota bacterium]